MYLRTHINRHDMSKWSNVLDGMSVFILGNGPSLTKNSLALLDNYFTIGVNRIFEVYYPTILFWQDIELIRDFKGKVDKCPSMKVCRDISDSNKLYTNYSLGLNPYKIHYHPERLYGRGCSSVLASELAISMGAGTIILLGCDGAPSKENSKHTDFYGKNKRHKKHTIQNFVKAMTWLKEECPIPVYCTHGCLKIWKSYSLEEIISEINPSKLSKIEYMSMLES